MNERIKELRKQVKVDMHLHNVEDIKAMEGCFGFEGGNKIVNDYIEKFAELIVRECIDTLSKRFMGDLNREDMEIRRCIEDVKKCFGVEE